jgi:hypothetical protein
LLQLAKDWFLLKVAGMVSKLLVRADILRIAIILLTA